LLTFFHLFHDFPRNHASAYIGSSPSDLLPLYINSWNIWNNGTNVIEQWVTLVYQPLILMEHMEQKPEVYKFYNLYLPYLPSMLTLGYLSAIEPGIGRKYSLG
jgi:GH15 family glucan-1,4-alpha-glucosidase